MKRIPKSYELLGHKITIRVCSTREWEALCEMCEKIEEDDYGVWFPDDNLIVIRRTKASLMWHMDLPFTRLEDWVPRWPLSWTVEINSGTPGMTVIRHRNQAKAGCHYVHGHLHRLGVHRQPTFAGPRYSVDAGSLADPESSGFDYTEGNVEHVQGFVVLTYHKGRLMPPELCEVVDGVAWFRGAPV